MITRKIGERFNYEGVTLEVVEGKSCSGCYFKGTCHYDDKASSASGNCVSMSRADGKSVVFVPVDTLTLIKEHIERLLYEANQMEEAYAGRKEEEFYSGMIHGLALISDYIKRKFENRK